MSNNAIFKSESLFNVNGWVAVVTGGGTGIGLMAAQALANNGARVYITGRREEALAQAVKVHGAELSSPGELIPLTCDVTSKQSISELVAEISKKEKHIDLLINNAGVAGKRSTLPEGASAEQVRDAFWTTEVEDWEQVYRTNVISYFFTTAAFLPLLHASTAAKQGHSASVINISSISGITSDNQGGQFMYNTSKAATIQLTNLLAGELCKPELKVRVNSIAPGYFPSEMTTDTSGKDQKSHISAGEGYGEAKGVPAGRPGKDEDMAQAVLMLACNQYANGQTLELDGGYLLRHP